jgi:nucleoside-diphosphate-sugar epimerase
MERNARRGQIPRILVIGANGQIGTELVEALSDRHGADVVVGSDLSTHGKSGAVKYEQLDVLDEAKLRSLAQNYNISQVYLLAAALSARAEEHPRWAWDLNTRSLLNVLELARELKLERVFWPSSIAAFGPSTPRLAPQSTVMDPTTVYGLSKLVGERWCAWYHGKYGVDVRSLRYPGLISYKAPPGGGTTDYAVEMFHAARNAKRYSCFIAEHQALPLMYMADALRATLELMNVPSGVIRERGSYNLAGISVTPAQLAASIRRHVPEFEVIYAPDFRQAIAASWPERIADAAAREDWGWAPRFDLNALVDDMLAHIPARTGLARAT